MATGQTDRELLLALMRNPGVIPNLDPFTYPQNAPNVPKEFGQEVLEFAQALERNPNRRATGLEEVVELIGKMGVINPLKTAGSLMQLDKPTAERMAQSGVEAAKRAYDDLPGTASRLAQGAKEALLDPVGTAGELSVSDIAGGSGLLSKLAGAANLTGPALMAAMVPGSDVPRPKKSRSEELIQEQLDRGETPGALEKNRLERIIKETQQGSGKTEKQLREELNVLNNQIEQLELEILDLGDYATDEKDLLYDLFDKQFIIEKQLSGRDMSDMSAAASTKIKSAKKSLEAYDAIDDAEKARLDRAVQQGFNIDAFHGTKGDITEFDPGLLGATTDVESARKGFFFSADPETAALYADLADAEKLGGGSGENIMPVKLQITNPFVRDFEGSSYREFSYNDLLKKARNEGHDGAIFRNTIDGNAITDVYVVFEPEQIKSRFATFDPEKTGSKDILASVPPVLFPLGVGAAAASYSANKEE
jgi:hypothetical protein